MFLQLGRDGVDSLRMEPTPMIKPAEPSDQELVDLYAIHAGGSQVTQMSVNQIHEAAEAAYVLELRGYIEQAGVWLHNNRPALHATA